MHRKASKVKLSKATTKFLNDVDNESQENVDCKSRDEAALTKKERIRLEEEERMRKEAIKYEKHKADLDALEEKNEQREREKEDLLYRVMSRNYQLTEQQLVDNGFPRPDPREKGKAVLKVDANRIQKQIQEPDKRRCDRCWSEYRVDKLGMQVIKENCVYHFNKKIGKTGAGWGYSCCQRGPKSKGCEVKKFHCTDVPDYNNLWGFVTTEDRNSGKENSGKVFALDCEMCNTTQGRELTKVTVIDYTGKTIYESLVKPENVVLDYNTRFSGITKEDLDGVTTRLMDVQAVLLAQFSCKDILVGHSLHSDLKALKLLHNTVVDTSVVFLQKKDGRKIKRSLKDLSEIYIKRIIQSGSGGHDSSEDALAALDLMKMKVREDV